MLMVILKNISCGHRKYFSSVGNSIFIIFRGMNERIYIKKKKNGIFGGAIHANVKNYIHPKRGPAESLSTRHEWFFSPPSSRFSAFRSRLSRRDISLNFLSSGSKFRRATTNEPRRSSPDSPEIAVPHAREIFTWTRRQSITGGCWNQPKCRLGGIRGKGGGDLLCEGRWMLSSTVVAVYQLKAPGPGPEFSNKRAVVLI